MSKSKRNLVLLGQFVGVAALTWVLYESLVESVIAGAVTVVLMYALFFK